MSKKIICAILRQGYGWQAAKVGGEGEIQMSDLGCLMYDF